MTCEHPGALITDHHLDGAGSLWWRLQCPDCGLDQPVPGVFDYNLLGEIPFMVCLWPGNWTVAHPDVLDAAGRSAIGRVTRRIGLRFEHIGETWAKVGVN